MASSTTTSGTSETRLRIVVYLTCEADPALGSAYVALGFAAQLAERGHSVDVVEPSDYEPFRRLRRANFYRQTVGILLHSLRSAIRRDRDILIFYGGEAWLTIRLLSLLPRRMRPLLVAHSNGLEPHCIAILRAAPPDEGAPRKRWFQIDLSELTSWGFRSVDGLVVVSDFEGRYAKARGWPANGRLLALENPLPRALLGLPPEEGRQNVVGFCGSWIHRKGIARLVREIPVFLRRNESWRFRVLGNSGEGLEQEFPADVRDRIEWVRPLSRETGLATEYRRLAILVSPSIYESFGLVIAEAMASGCAVVASPVGFAAHLADGVEVLHCDAGEPGRLAEALETVARDRALRLRIVQGGWNRVQALTWQSAGSTFDTALKAWAEAVEPPADPPPGPRISSPEPPSTTPGSAR
jgi:glycosyltransferase involved in cell wall biosynthesis